MSIIDEKIEKEISESVQQLKVCEWLDKHNLVYFAVPNGKWTSIQQAIKSQREGLKKGVPDLIILEKNKDDKFTVLEMKKYKGKNHKTPCNCMSEEQKLWMDIFYKKGWTCVLAHGSEEAIQDLSKLYNIDLDFHL